MASKFESASPSPERRSDAALVFLVCRLFKIGVVRKSYSSWRIVFFQVIELLHDIAICIERTEIRLVEQAQGNDQVKRLMFKR